MTDDRLVVGLVRGVHGLRGVVRVEILSDNPDRFAVGNVLHREGDVRALTISSSVTLRCRGARAGGRRFLKIENIDGRKS